MIWDGNGYPVKRCCAKCVRGTKAFGETSCGKPSCRCHVSAAFVAGADSLGAQGHETTPQALVDGFDSAGALDAIFQNETTRRK